jgi:hypothetical protein
MRLRTAWFVIILVVVNLRAVQGFCPSSRFVSRAAVRRGTFPALADGADDGPAFVFESDDEFEAIVTDPIERLILRQKLFENTVKVRQASVETTMMAGLASLKSTMMAGFKQLTKDRAADRKALQEASDKRDKTQMLVATALAAWMMLAPKLLEVVLASVPHATQ